MDDTHGARITTPLPPSGEVPLPRPPRQYARLRPEPPLLPEPPARRTRSRLGVLVLVALASGLVGSLLTLGGFLLLDDDPAPAPAAPPGTVVERITTEIVTDGNGASAAPAVARRVIPSIVTVEVTNGAGDFLVEGSGSGVVIGADGYIVTNEHVVGDSDRVRVVFSDGRMYEATVIGTDAFTDLAVLEVEADGLVPIEYGSSQGLSIGDAAIAVGSPLGLEGGPSVTLGVISAFQRQVQTGPDAVNDRLYGMIQTDAPITRGSSGGALVDVRGRLIGITTAIGVSNVGAEGIGFAIPIELVRRVSDEIIAEGRARHAFLGISGTTDFEESDDGALVPVGVRVQAVESGTAADDAGIRAEDRITAVDGEAVLTMDRLIVALREYPVGTVVTVSVTRSGSRVDVGVTLGERP